MYECFDVLVKICCVKLCMYIGHQKLYIGCIKNESFRNHAIVVFNLAQDFMLLVI
jgi:hypothetical protein